MSEIIKILRSTKVKIVRSRPVLPELKEEPSPGVPELAVERQEDAPVESPVREIADGPDNQEKILAEEYQRGFADGCRHAESGIRNEEEFRRKQEARRIEEFLDKASEQISHLYGASEQAILRFALGLAERIIRREVSLEQSFILRHIRDGVQRILGVERIKIRVHPQDLPAVRDHRNEIQSHGDSLREVVVEADEHLNPGDLILESELGNVDARISTQLKQIENALFESKVIA